MKKEIYGVKITNKLLNVILSESSSEEEVFAYASSVEDQIITAMNEFSKKKKSDFIQDAFDDTDKMISEILSDQSELKVSCKKGCANCCYQEVSVSAEETKAALIESKRVGYEIDWSHVESQSIVPFDEKNPEIFMQLGFEKRRCVFLSDNNLCSIYKARPLMCRTYLVYSDPENCDTAHGIKYVQQGVSIKAEVLMSAIANLKPALPFAKMLKKYRKWFENENQ